MNEVLSTVLISLGSSVATGFGSWIFFRKKHKAEADGVTINNDRAEIESLNLIAKEWRETAQSWKSMADEYRLKYMDYQREVETLAEQVSELSIKLNRANRRIAHLEEIKGLQEGSNTTPTDGHE